MKTSELQSVRICCKVSNKILHEIEKLSRKKGISHQQVVTDLITAQLEGTNGIAKQNQFDSSGLYRCRAKLTEIDRELRGLIDTVNYLKMRV
jgi:hypothetical protein